MRKITGIAAVVVVWHVLGITSAFAAPVTLSEWAINLDGFITDSLLGDPLPTAVNASQFDVGTGLGTVIITVGGAGKHVVGLFVDHELDKLRNGFTPEFGAVQGTPAPGQSWEIDEPGFHVPFGDIFAHFTAGHLDITNSVPSTMPNDVAMALSWDLLLGPGDIAVVTFVLSDGPVPSGFALTHTDADSSSQGTLAFASALSIQSVPEPGTWLLLGSGLVGVLASRRRWCPRG